MINYTNYFIISYILYKSIIFKNDVLYKYRYLPWFIDEKYI